MMTKTKRRDNMMMVDNIRSQLRRTYALGRVETGDYSFWKDKNALRETEKEACSFVHTAEKLAQFMPQECFEDMLLKLSDEIYRTKTDRR